MKMINTDFNYSYRKARAGAEVEEGRCGRYASAALSMAGTVILAGGMTNCDDKHQVRAHGSAKATKIESSCLNEIPLLMLPMGMWGPENMKIKKFRWGLFEFYIFLS